MNYFITTWKREQPMNTYTEVTGLTKKEAFSRFYEIQKQTNHAPGVFLYQVSYIGRDGFPKHGLKHRIYGV